MTLLQWIINTAAGFALTWALVKICSLARRIDRMAQLREHPEFYERKSLWRVLNEIL